MPGTRVQLGPFGGGLNTYSPITSIADDELSQCVNLELDLDGTLLSRPPIARGTTFPAKEMHILGQFVGSGDTLYILASDGDSATYVMQGAMGLWTLVTDTFAAAGMAQFNGQAHLVSPTYAANPGGTWTPTGGFVADPAMPRGTTILGWKGRLWVAGDTDHPSRVTNSNVFNQPSLWVLDANNYIEFGAGDGQKVVSIVLYYGVLLVFRDHSVFSFSFQADPAAGVVSTVLGAVGLDSADAIVVYENYLYFLYNSALYQFVNNRAQQINVKVPFVQGTPGVGRVWGTRVAVDIFDQRVVCQFYGNTYVYSLRTQTWTQWSSTQWGALGHIQELRGSYADGPLAILHRADTDPASTSTETLWMHSGLDSAWRESMPHQITTKSYDYKIPTQYKRLFWWGVNLDTVAQVSGTVTAEIGGSITGSVTVKDTDSGKSLLRYSSSGIRFRRVHFTVSFTTDGSRQSHLLSLITFVSPKEQISKALA